MSLFSEKKGFSLIEMMVVIAIIGTLTSFSLYCLQGAFGASKLGTSGYQCVNVLDSAREMAIASKSPMAVAFIPPGPHSPTALVILACDSDSGKWTQVSKWENLAYGVVMDPSFRPDSNSALVANSPSISPALPTLNRGGAPYAPGSYAYLVFLPSGALYQTASNPGMLRLINGVIDGGSVRVTGAPGNYFDVVVNSSTGCVKTVRLE